MAGNEEQPNMQPEMPADQKGEAVPPPAKATKPRVKSFHCINCGAAVTIRYPGVSLSVICSGCHSVIDATDENYRILTKYFKATGQYQPLLELGSRGKLRGHLWEVIGYMVRSDVSSGYPWEEYLLFNPYYGYRWLTQDKGHWNIVTTIKRKPKRYLTSETELDGRKFKLYNTGRAQVDYVIGEFYWRVMLNTQVTMTDYLDAPQMLSMEKDDKEVIWSLSEYIEPEEVAKAFKPQTKFPRPDGVAATEPPKLKIRHNKIMMLFMIFWGIITCGQIYYSGTALNETALDYTNNFVPNTKQADITTPVFTLKKDKANVAISFNAPVDNSWFWAGGELVNDDTGVSYPFEQDAEYYYGVDDGEAWSEGSGFTKTIIPAVPAGKYYVNMDIESGSFKTTNPRAFSVTIKRNVPNWDNYVWSMIFLSILPIISWCMMRQTEVARWANSDYSPYVSSGS